MRNFKFTIRGHIYEVDILKFENGSAKIEVNGTPYDVEVHKAEQETKTPVLVRPEIKHPKGAHKIKKQAESLVKVKAPLPGVIISVFVVPGDKIEKGTKLITYEAMKMENNLLSDSDGTIKAVYVNQGDNVLEGDVIIDIE